jgi:hypothetical protein
MNTNWLKTENQDIPFLLLILILVSISSIANTFLAKKSNPSTVQTHWFFIPEASLEATNHFDNSNAFVANEMDSSFNDSPHEMK